MSCITVSTRARVGNSGTTTISGCIRLRRRRHRGLDSPALGSLVMASGRIRVGTASWTDPSLIKCGGFYPKGCNTPEARLRHYAGQFPMVEVDSSYYALPSSRNSEAWV